MRTFHARCTARTDPDADAATLVKVHIQTGRTHQIRCHMQHIGHSLCGDVKYGGRRSWSSVSFPQMLLHASRLGFNTPESASAAESKWVMVSDPMPPPFTAAL